MVGGRKQKVAQAIKEQAALFFQNKSNKTSLMTFTRASVSSDLKRATVYVTILPEERETPAIEFLKRKRKSFREFLKKKMNLKNIPFIEIELDAGEKNRQKIDRLLKE